MRARGFTFLEILVSVSILGLVLSVGVVSLNRSTRQASSSGVAELLADELRNARQRAMARHLPVALSFPSPVSCGFSWLEGEHDPRVVRVRNFQREFPTTRFFVGRWDLSGASDTLDPPAQATVAALNIDSWFSAPPPLDYLLAFRPDGTLMTNDLPLYQGKYHLVVCQGCSFSTTGAPPGTPGLASGGPAYFRLDSVAEPQTICLEPSGAISVEGGIPALGNGVAVTRGSQQTAGALAPARGAPNNTVPTVTQVDFLPEPPSTPPAGVRTIVSPTEYVQMNVEATDPDGDQLFCRWNSSGGTFSGGAPGGGQAVRMRFDAASGTYRSTWTFHADPRDAHLTRYDLQCVVSDDQGGQGVAGGGVQLSHTLELRKQPKYVVAQMLLSPVVGLYLHTINQDGSDLRRIPNTRPMPYIVTNPAVSTDGTKVAYFDVFGWSLRVINLDGTDERILNTSPAGATKMFPCFDPDGTRVAYTQGSDVWLAPVDGGPAVQIASGWMWPEFNADGTKLVVRNGNQMGVIDLSGPLPPPPPTVIYTAPAGTTICFPQFYKGPVAAGPDPYVNDDLIMFQEGQAGTMMGGGGPVQVLRLSNPVPQTIIGGLPESYLSWSSDGRHIGYYYYGSEMHVAEFDIATNSVTGDRTITPPGLDFFGIHL